MLLFCEHEGSRGVAGNGEEMAVTKVELKKDKESSNRKNSTGKTAGNKTGSKPKSVSKSTTDAAAASSPGEMVPISRSAGAKLGRTAGGKGAVWLRRAADKQLAQNAEKLAEVLSKEALVGNLGSAKMLVGLAERVDTVPESGAKRRRLTQAQRLERDKRWDGPLDGEEAGNRE